MKLLKHGQRQFIIVLMIRLISNAVDQQATVHALPSNMIHSRSRQALFDSGTRAYMLALGIVFSTLRPILLFKHFFAV